MKSVRIISLRDFADGLAGKPKKHSKCAGEFDYFGEFDCGYGTAISCDECKYGGHGGRKDPEAKCNQPKP